MAITITVLVLLGGFIITLIVMGSVEKENPHMTGKEAYLWTILNTRIWEVENGENKCTRGSC